VRIKTRLIAGKILFAGTNFPHDIFP